MATTSGSGQPSATPEARIQCDGAHVPGNETALHDGGRLGVVICQFFGLLALALIIYTFLMGGDRRILLVVAGMAPIPLVIARPNLILYGFILSFFISVVIFQRGWMFSVMATDLIFIALVFAFISRNRVDFKAVLKEQRNLFMILLLFMLWTIVGYVVNLYSHEFFVNATSVFFIFNIFQLVAIVVLFTQSHWKQYREKAIFFYVACVFCEIVAAFGVQILGGAYSLFGFKKMTGLLGVHHGLLANVMVLSFGVCTAAYFVLKGRFVKLFSVCVGIACLGTLLLSGSRGSIMGLIIAMPITAVLGYRLKRNTLLLLALSLAVAFVIFWLSPLKEVISMANFQSADTADKSAYGRILIWERVYEHALYGPWVQKIFGIGIGTFNTLQFSYHLEVGTFTTGAHNNLLHAFVETGVVGLMIFSAIFVEIVRRLVVMSRRGNNAARCFLVATLGLLFSCLTQETFWPNPSFARFMLMYMFTYVALLNFSGKPSPHS